MGHDSYRSAQLHDSFGKQLPADIPREEPAPAPDPFLGQLVLYVKQRWATVH